MTCEHHEGFVRDIAALTEQNKTQFKVLKTVERDLKDMKNEIKGLYNGRMTALITKVLEQSSSDRREELEYKLKEKELEAQKWKGRTKAYSGYAAAAAAIITKLIDVIF